jgi:imidazolonepropionase-like amidohydrolase
MIRFPAMLLLPLAASAETVALKNFTMIDGTGARPRAEMAMLINDGAIRWTGPARDLKVPAGAPVVDLTGKFVMPGIINLHGHVGGTVGLAQDPKFYTRENVEKQLHTYATYGVTTVVSLGTDLDPIYEVRAAQRVQHSTSAPATARVYTAGRGFVLKSGSPAAGGFRIEVETPADCKARVDELAAKHVDVIKMWVDDSFGRGKKLPIELSSELIRDALQHKIKAVAHIVNLSDAKELVDAGIDGLAHSVRDQPVDDALIAAMKKRGSWLMSATLTREISTFIYAEQPKFLEDPFFTRGTTPEVIAGLKAPQYVDRIKNDRDFPRFHGLLDMAKRNLKKMYDAGVKVGFGTDSGPPARFQGYFEHWEMELMVDAGLTPAQVITAATRDAAVFLGARELGTLAAGKQADLIVLTKNPLDDIRNTRTIEAVYVAGGLVK